MRRFPFTYYTGMLSLVFILYASFLRTIVPSFQLFMIGVVSGAGAITLILIAIGVAWKAEDHA